MAEVNGAVVAAREDVLDLYAEEYEEKRPKVNFDETSRQLLADTRRPVEAAAGRPRRYDYEYERNARATCSYAVSLKQDGAMWKLVSGERSRTWRSK